MKAGTAKRKEEERRERIRRILDAGGRLFLKKGYLNTTMRDICAAAELSTGAVYFYFKSKDEIYAEICVESLNLLLELFEQVVQRFSKPLERIFGFQKAIVRFYSCHTERWKMLTSGYRNAGLEQELLNKIEEAQNRVLLLTEETVRGYLKGKSIDDRYHSREVTMGLWAIVEGVLTLQDQGHFVHTEMTLEELMDMQIRIYLKGLKINSE